MLLLKGLFVFDCATVCILVILASLCERLGHALKIPPYFRFLYGAALCVAAGTALMTFTDVLPVALTVSLCLRALAGIVAVGICLRYWHWLFGEHFKV